MRRDKGDIVNYETLRRILVIHDVPFVFFEEVMKMFAPVTPAPSDEVCRQLLVDELSK